MRTILIASTLTVAGFLAGSAWAADAKAGQAPYEKACKSCHGPDGAPSAAVAKMMKVEIKDLKDPEVQSMSNDAIKKIILEGKGKMPKSTAVAAGDAENVAAYVHSFKK